MITPPYTVTCKTRAIFRPEPSMERLVAKKIKATTDPVESQLRFEANFYGDWYSESVLAAYLSEQSADASTSPLVQPELDVTSDQKDTVKNKEHLVNDRLKVFSLHPRRGE